MGFIRQLLCLAAFVLPSYFMSTASAEEVNLSTEELGFSQKLFKTKQAQLRAVPLDVQTKVDLELEKFSVFAPDAKILVQTAAGTQTLNLPSTSYFKGQVVDNKESAAFLAVDENGQTRSIIQANHQLYINNNSKHAPNQFNSRAINPSQDFKDKNFSCGINEKTKFRPPVLVKMQQTRALNTIPKAATNNTYIADLIIETDYEFYSLFNDTNAAAKYVADLIAYVSSLYMGEINTKLRIAQLILYTTPNDPWSAQDTSSALYQLQAYYITNRTSSKRSTVHFLSGKDMGGGIAFIGTICTAPSYAGARYGSYDFGVSSSISGSFSSNSPFIAWDAFVVAHELGHNFGSAHTHAYDVAHDYSSPIDCCVSEGTGTCANYTPYTSLPGLGTLTGGTTATHPGTIMSYCHLVSGGSQNLSMTFGTNHPYGIDAKRVPAEMRSTVEMYAQAFPQCLPVDNQTTTSFGFATVSKWHDSFVADKDVPLLGDFNGDGKDDVASFTQSSKQLYVALSTGTRLADKQLWKTNLDALPTQLAVGDFDGDGKDDLVKLTTTPLSGTQLFVSLSTGSSFAADTLWFSSGSFQTGSLLVGDFNGNGKDDIAIVQASTGSIFINLSQGSRFRIQRLWSNIAALNAKRLVVGDFNGDHQDDIGFSLADGSFKVSLSLGMAKQFAPASTWHSNLASSINQLVVGDFNADGKDDIASYTETAQGGIYLALAKDGAFGTNQKAHAWFAPYDQLLAAGRLTNDNASDVITFTRGNAADVWVGTGLQQ